MAGVTAWPASYASSHPSTCKCFHIVRSHVHLLPVVQQPVTYQNRHQTLHKRKRSLHICAAVAEQSAQDQALETDVATKSSNGLVDTSDASHETVPVQAGNSGPSTQSEAEAGGSSTYTKKERASLANIPESEMTPEMLRRWRISQANKGRQPWNKGRNHPPGSHFRRSLWLKANSCLPNPQSTTLA